VGAIPEVAGYGDSTYRVRLSALVRGYVGVTGYDREARGIAARGCIEAARTRDDLADIVNAGIEELVRHRRELPTFGALLKLACNARTLVNRAYHRQIAANLASGAGERLAALLLVPSGATRSGWDQAKADPPRPSPQRMREHLAHLAWLREQAVADEVFKGVPDRKLRQFAAEARALGAADLSQTLESRRLALMAALLRHQVAQALDDAAEMFVRLTTRMHNRAKEALDEHRAQQAAETDALVVLLRQTVLACQDQKAERDGRLAAIEGLLLPDADAILVKCEAHAAFAGNNYLPLLARFYGAQRAAFLRFLAHAAPVSTSQDRATEQAIGFLLAHRTDRKAKLRTTVDAPGADGATVQRPLDLSWVGEKWWPLLTGRTTREPAPAEVDRRYFEICLFTQVVNELKSGDLCIPGSEEYGDYRAQLVTWEEYERDVAGYAEQAGFPADPGAFVAALEARLVKTAGAVDHAFPKNEHVEIVAGEPMVKRLRARDATDGTAFLERLLEARMVPAGVLDALADTEHWLGWTRHFGPVSGFEAKLDRPRERYLATAFCYGCGLGPSQAARSLKGLDRRHVAFTNQRHFTEQNLDAAITGVIDAYARVGLHRHWGTGDTASADGMKWDVHPESLKTSYHIRYGGYGGIGYYLVSDTYIALFSRFLACGAYEGHAILDFVVENRSLLQPSTLHSDTHGQSPYLRIGAPPRHRTDAPHPQLAGPAPVPARRGRPLRTHRRPVHRHHRLAPDRGACAGHAARRSLGPRRAPAAVRHSAPACYPQPQEPALLCIPGARPGYPDGFLAPLPWINRIAPRYRRRYQTRASCSTATPSGSPSAAPGWQPRPSATSSARWSSTTTWSPTCSSSTPPSARRGRWTR